MAASNDAVEALLPELAKLKQAVKDSQDDAVSFRKHNTSFEQRNDTTQLLNTVAEQLWTEKLAMEQAQFEEHTSELPYLCQHFRTSVEEGLPESIYAEKALDLMTKRRNSGLVTDPKPRRFFASCCSSDFPPQQAWWVEISALLTPKFMVLRAGKLSSVAASDLVLGDIVYISAGQRAAADARVLVTMAPPEVTAVDVSHLTSRCNDVRICSPNVTGSGVTESRNILLKDGHLISGALFCMVVRTCTDPFIPASAYGGQESYEINIDTTLPAALSTSSCQKLFKALCSRANLFCKSFKVMEQIAGTRHVIIMLTQELLAKGSVPAFHSAMTKLKRTVVFINCDCSQQQLAGLCQKLGIECSEFEDPEHPRTSTHSKGSKHSEDSLEYATMGSIDLRFMESIGEYQQGRLNTLMKQLQNASPVVIVVNGISEVALIRLCRELGNPEKPLLYVMADFFYAKCFCTLAIETVHQRPCAAQGGLSEESTNIGSTSLDSPVPAGGESYSPVLNPPPTPKAEDMDIRGSMTSERTTTPYRSDPAPHFMVQPVAQCQSAKGSQVFVSLNSIGIVSEHSDCILLKPDLGLLGLALEIIAKKLRR